MIMDHAHVRRFSERNSVINFCVLCLFRQSSLSWGRPHSPTNKQLTSVRLPDFRPRFEKSAAGGWKAEKDPTDLTRFRPPDGCERSIPSFVVLFIVNTYAVVLL